MLKCANCGRIFTDDSAQEIGCPCSPGKTVLLHDGPLQETTVAERTTQLLSAATTARPASGVFRSSIDAEATLQPASEKYEYLQKLGAGGMGEVVRAWDRDLRRFVAIKRLLSGPDSDETILRFVKEAQITGQLEHPNIVPVHDLGTDSNGRVYFSLKLIEGESLKNIIEKRKTAQEVVPGLKYRDVYTPLKMIEIFISICQAVAYAHSKGVIHRDLKPDNVMLGRYGEVLVVDWGIAKVLSGEISPEDQKTLPLTALESLPPEESMEGDIAGTPAYMSPEQAEGRVSAIGVRSDVYSLGAVLYHLISGRPPYEGSSSLDVLQKVRRDPPKPLVRGTFGFQPVARELKAICAKAMSREPESRYATANALSDDLQAYLENRPIDACPATPFERFAKWLKRNRAQVQTTSIAVVSAVVLLVSAYYGYREWRVRGLLRDAGSQLAAFRRNQSSMAGSESDAALAYDALNRVLLDLQRALDLSPRRASTISMLSDTYMEQWRIATRQENLPLAENARREVVRYEGGEPNRYSPELNGSAVVVLQPDPIEADLFLFKFVPLDTRSVDGLAASRLVPIPYDLAAGDIVATGFNSEVRRAQSGPAVMAGVHTIFNLEPAPQSRIPPDSRRELHLRPGSYLILARAPNRVETRVPLLVPRSGRVEQTILLPPSDGLVPGFFYIAGGPARIGGGSANALPAQEVTIRPFMMYHDEIGMGDYAEFLKALVRAGHKAEAVARVPRDFGKEIATLGPDGSLRGKFASDQALFLASAVRGVSHNDVQAYIAWRSQRDNLPYRLPTEVEWESVCRGADGRRYSWGNSYAPGFAFLLQSYSDMGGDRSWHWEDYKDESPWGVHNLAGGVAEWTSSAYNPAARAGDAEYGQFAIRGDAWSLPPVGLECAFRTSGQPEYFHPTIGFRLALDYPVANQAALKQLLNQASGNDMHMAPGQEMPGHP